MAREAETRVGLIGYGAIAREVAARVAINDHVTIVGALVLPHECDQDAPFPLVDNISSLLQEKPTLIVECAGHEAVKSYAEPVLAHNLDLMIISIGALADPELYAEITEASARSSAQVILPAGALAGLDGLGAAARAGLEWVRITSSKPPLAWSGAPGVEGVDLAGIHEETVIFSGTAREAALAFPKNANVAATAALGGVGFEKTQVQLIADPKAERNTHVLEFEGVPGLYRVETAGLPSLDNPKTSMLTAYNILRSIENRSEAIVI